MKKAVNLIFPKQRIKEPIIYNLGQRFKVVTNIKRANVTHEEGWVVLEMEGIKGEIENAIKWLNSLGVRVEPVGAEMN
jgi:ABC-type methionine transport system ATPase subunit